MNKFSCAGIWFTAIGIAVREYYHSAATSTWMRQAFEQGKTFGPGEAPMNLFHTEWPLSLSIELFGYGSLTAIFGGVVLTVFGLARGNS